MSSSLGLVQSKRRGLTIDVWLAGTYPLPLKSA